MSAQSATPLSTVWRDGLGRSEQVGRSRSQWFDLHVPWYRLNTIVDITLDSGQLLTGVLDEFASTEAVLIDLANDVNAAQERLGRFTERVQVRSWSDSVDLPHGADVYLLPEGVHQIDGGRLQGLLQSVSRACVPSGRALACVPSSDRDRIIAAADSVGLEVTRLGGDDDLALIEFGSGPLRVLPGG